jgi:hypothetical protein
MAQKQYRRVIVILRLGYDKATYTYLTKQIFTCYLITKLKHRNINPRAILVATIYF